MSILYQERQSDAPYIEAVTRGQTLSTDSIVRPAEVCWHMVYRPATRYNDALTDIDAPDRTQAEIA